MGDSTGVGIAHNAFGIIGELEFPATFTYLGDMAFAENECLTSVIFNNKVSAGYYGTNDDDTSDVLVNHWATYPPFRNCPVTHW
jgi:hypothetical protein